MLSDDAVPAPWRAFFEAHTAPTFFKQLLALWGDAMRSAHPRLEDNFGKASRGLYRRRSVPGQVG